MSERLLIEKLDHTHTSLRRARNDVIPAARRVLRYQKKAHWTSRERFTYGVRTDCGAPTAQRREQKALDAPCELRLQCRIQHGRIQHQLALQSPRNAAARRLLQAGETSVHPETTAPELAEQVRDDRRVVIGNVSEAHQGIGVVMIATPDTRALSRVLGRTISIWMTFGHRIGS
jgi:hypothetical protein